MDLDSLLAVADQEYARLTSLRAAFTQRIENPLIGRTREGRGTWYQAGRRFFRMDFDDPPGDVYVADGVCLWLYEPSLHPDQVGTSLLEDGTEIGSVDILGRLLSEARTRYDGVYEGLASVAGTSTHHVSLTPRGPSQYVDVQVWIAESDRLVRRFRIEEENQTVRTVTLSSLEPQIPIADSVFRFTPPVGVSVFGADGRCG